MEKPFPQVPQGLLEHLTRLFRDQLPANPESAEHTARLIGQQDVIRKLRSEYDRQNNNQ